MVHEDHEDDEEKDSVGSTIARPCNTYLCILWLLLTHLVFLFCSVLWIALLTMFLLWFFDTIQYGDSTTHKSWHPTDVNTSGSNDAAVNKKEGGVPIVW